MKQQTCAFKSLKMILICVLRDKKRFWAFSLKRPVAIFDLLCWLECKMLFFLLLIIMCHKYMSLELRQLNLCWSRNIELVFSKSIKKKSCTSNSVRESWKVSLHEFHHKSTILALFLSWLVQKLFQVLVLCMGAPP